jgi:hypothetical protein
VVAAPSGTATYAPNDSNQETLKAKESES